MNILIRRAARSDAHALTQLLAELFSMETDFVIDAKKQERGLSMMLSDTDGRIVYVATDNGNIMGMVTAQRVVSTACGGYGALLEDMIVREAYRRQGVGEALFHAVKQWALAKGASRIQLLADQRNRPALAFYERQGFFESSMRGFYLPLDNG